MIKLVPGVNDLETLCPDIARQWSTRNLNEPSSVSKGSNKKVWWVCAKGHEWFIQPAHRTRENASGCPYCSGRYPVVGETDLASTHPHLALQWSRKNSINITEISFSSNKKVVWECELGHEWVVSPNSRTNKNKKETNCPTCAGSRVLSGFNDLGAIDQELVSQWDESNIVDLTSVSSGSNYRALWVCSSGHRWEATVKDRTRQDGKKSDCPRCYGSVSKKEIELFEYVKEILPSVEVVQSSRRVIPPYELDIYIPDMKIAIEFNGLYWHSEESGKDKHYHSIKRKLCQEQGIQLITVWEDDWRCNRPLIERMMANKLGVSNSRTVYARKTEVVHVTREEAFSLLNANHIQGQASGSYYLGLREKVSGELLAVMVLTRSKNQLTLDRYATNCNLPGGHSKLISWVRNSIEFDKIVTFADLEISDGGLYETTGWVKDKVLPPDYKYVYRDKRVHKFNFRLNRFRDDPDLLWEDGRTEKQLAEMNGLLTVWDCGKIRYTLKKENI